jgi:hypothetical protein
MGRLIEQSQFLEVAHSGYHTDIDQAQLQTSEPTGSPFGVGISPELPDVRMKQVRGKYQ